MIQEIKFNGHTAVPSDHESPDGDLALSLNLIPEDGALRPILPPRYLFEIGSDQKLFIHHTNSFTNYIAYSSQSATLKWVASKKVERIVVFDEFISLDTPSFLGTLTSVTAVGNIIIVSTSSNLFYIRYDSNNEKYIFLGTRMPEITLELGLKLNFTMSDIQDKSFDVVFASTANPRPGTTSQDDDWQSVLATSYDVSVENGMLSHDNYPQESLRDSYVATPLIPLDSDFKILPGVEYKIRWDIVWGAHEALILQIWGKKNGSSELEYITGGANEKVSANSVEIKRTFSDGYSDLSYRLSFRYLDKSSAIPRTQGNITFFRGIDNSETGSDQVSSYIEYTKESHDAIMGATNEYVNQLITKKNRFIFPFFVRYAVQLFNGSYSFISEPILMIPNSGYAPAIMFSKHAALGTRLLISSFAADLKYLVSSAVPEDWEDLILGVDIFVSSPIWMYDQSQEYDGASNHFRFSSTVDSFGYGTLYYDNEPLTFDDFTNLDIFTKLSLQDYIDRYAVSVNTTNFVQIAPRAEDEIEKDLISKSTFYKICSLGLSELKNTSDFNDIKMEEGTLSSLVTRQPLDHDSIIYEGFKDGSLTSYNNRLHICNSSVIIQKPAHPKRCNQYINEPDGYAITTYIFLATEDGKKLTLKKEHGWTTGQWFFYPDSRAYKAAFVLSDPSGEEVWGVAEIELKRHDMLNGAYWYSGGLTRILDFNLSDSNPYPTIPDDSIKTRSTIYISESNCPFSFKISSVVTVGANKVLSLSSAARALSQGQFGQFPLYAFTDEGVWALEVAPTGTYSARQPITRDVCTNPDAITQLDSAVLFPTDRGIMLISGSQTQCITDTINTRYPFDPLSLPAFQKLHGMLNHSPESDSCLPTLPFPDFLRKCRMIYDYVHQRVIVYAPGVTYAYVFSLESKQWGMTFSNIVTHLNSYPEALAIDHSGAILNFSASPDCSEATAEGASIPALLLTRPLKLGSPDILKTVDTVITRGMFAKGHVATVLYGSRDLINWHLVWSSKDHYLRGFRGSPYKYFRLAALATLDPAESIHGASIQFNPRLTNQPR